MLNKILLIIKKYIYILLLFNYILFIVIPMQKYYKNILYLYDPVQIITIIISLLAALLLSNEDIKRLKIVDNNNEEIRFIIILNILNKIVQFQILNWIITTIVNFIVWFIILDNNLEYVFQDIKLLSLIIQHLKYTIIPSFYLCIILIVFYIPKLIIKIKIKDIKILEMYEMINKSKSN